MLHNKHGHGKEQKEDIKTNQMKFLEMKITISKMEKALGRVNSILDSAKEKIF